MKFQWGAFMLAASMCDAKPSTSPEAAVSISSRALVLQRGTSCALIEQHTHCWGDTQFADRHSADAQSIALAGGSWQICALMEDGRVRCGDGVDAIEFEAPVGASQLRSDTKGRFLCVEGKTLVDPQCTWVWPAHSPIAWAERASFSFPLALARGLPWSGDPIAGCTTNDGHVACWDVAPGRAATVQRIVRPHFTAQSHIEWLSSDANLEHGCAIDDAGALACWLDAQVVFDHPGPAKAALVRRASFHTQFACLVDTAGRVYCRGHGEWGQADSEDWSPVNGLAAVEDLAASDAHVCARTIEQRIYCWGQNRWGESSGVTPTFWQPLEPVQGIPPIERLTIAGNMNCAQDRAGRDWCWGTPGFERSAGVLASNARVVPLASFTPHLCEQPSPCESVGETSPSQEPLPSVRWPPARVRHRGVLHECGLREGGIVLCHGNNALGQLGRPDPETVHEPTLIRSR